MPYHPAQGRITARYKEKKRLEKQRLEDERRKNRSTAKGKEIKKKRK
jgi:hypothetical protein